MTVVTLVTAIGMCRSWSWFNATLLNKQFRHRSVSTQLNICSFALQATPVDLYEQIQHFYSHRIYATSVILSLISLLSDF